MSVRHFTAKDTEVVYVTYPHWMDAHSGFEHAALLDSYHPVRLYPNGNLP
jgi:hypothetical protein